MRFAIAALIIGAGLSSAQSISNTCQSALLSIIASPDAQCLNPSALLSLATSSSNSSLIGPMTNWLQGLCSQAPCTNSSISAVVTNVTSGCSSDLASFGLTESNPSELITLVEQFYPALRQVGCLKDNSANQLCVPELLTDIQASVGTISLSTIIRIIPDFITGNSSLPQNVTCSNCVKQGFNIIQTDFPSLLPASASSDLSSTCGSAFTNGATPTDISESASTGTSASKSGATSLFSVSSFVAVVVSTLIAMSSAFAVLA